jgi:hypothetical protein
MQKGTENPKTLRHLDGVGVAGGLLAGQVHAAKGAAADGLDDLEVVDAHGGRGVARAAVRAGRACRWDQGCR